MDERRKYKRYKPIFDMKAMIIPYMELSTGRVQLDPLEGGILDYSDGGIRVHIDNKVGLDYSRHVWLHQELYVIMQMADDTFYTLKGKLMRFIGHPRDEQFDFGIMFVEGQDDVGMFPVEDINAFRDKLHEISVEAEEV